jgi:hypothetical protein
MDHAIDYVNYTPTDEDKKRLDALREKFGVHFDTAMGHADKLGNGSKWGPAYGFDLGGGKFWFGGYCSS